MNGPCSKPALFPATSPAKAVDHAHGDHGYTIVLTSEFLGIPVSELFAFFVGDASALSRDHLAGHSASET